MNPHHHRFSTTAATVPSPSLGVIAGLLALDLAIWSFVFHQAANLAS